MTAVKTAVTTSFALVGLGKMGANMARRWARGGVRAALFDQTAEVTSALATELGVPAPVMSLALMMRYATQGNNDYAAKLLAKMRQGFGGHAVSVQMPDSAR